jgi:hypothetical protein
MYSQWRGIFLYTAENKGIGKVAKWTVQEKTGTQPTKVSECNNATYLRHHGNVLSIGRNKYVSFTTAVWSQTRFK